MASRSSRIRPSSVNWPEQLVHALARAADHRRQVALGQVRAQPDRPVGRRRPALLGEPDEPRRQPARDVEEVQLLDVASSGAAARRRSRPGARRGPRPRWRSARGTDRAAGPRSRSALSAVALAERGAPSSSASSPKTSPARSVARIASSPVSDGSEILTSPLTITNRASPGSPMWKMTSPRRKRRDRMPRREALEGGRRRGPPKNGMAARDVEDRSGASSIVPHRTSVTAVSQPTHASSRSHAGPSMPAMSDSSGIASA